MTEPDIFQMEWTAEMEAELQRLFAELEQECPLPLFTPDADPTDEQR